MNNPTHFTCYHDGNSMITESHCSEEDAMNAAKHLVDDKNKKHAFVARIIYLVTQSHEVTQVGVR